MLDTWRASFDPTPGSVNPRQSGRTFGGFKGTHTEEGGPVPPTGKSVAADYVYAMEFEGGKIRHMTKVRNDGHSLRQLGGGIPM